MTNDLNNFFIRIDLFLILLESKIINKNVYSNEIISPLLNTTQITIDYILNGLEHTGKDLKENLIETTFYNNMQYTNRLIEQYNRTGGIYYNDNTRARTI